MYQKLSAEFYDHDLPFASEQEIDFYSQFFTKDQLILEPMCGSGRLLIPMLEAGFKVHGLDNSLHMLENCRNRLKQHNLQTELFEESVTKVSLSRQYDGIIIPFGSFQLLYPRTVAYETLGKLHHYLKPGGKIILDIFIPWETMQLADEEETREKQIILPDGNIITHHSYLKINKFEQYGINHHVYEKVVSGKVIEKEEENLYLCWYFWYEFELILEKHGFSNIKRFKDIVNKEELIIYIAEKV